MSKISTYENPEVAERIAELLAEKNAVQWARRFGCNRKTIYRYRDGTSSMPIAFLRKLCAETGASADWVLFGGDR